MRTTVTLSQNLGIDPFYIFDREIDEVIMLINFYLMLGDEKPKENTSSQGINDGFWDM